MHRSKHVFRYMLAGALVNGLVPAVALAETPSDIAGRVMPTALLTLR